MASSGSSGKQPMSRRQLVELRQDAAGSTNAGSSEDDDGPVGDTIERLGMRMAVLASKNDRLQSENEHLNDTVGAQQEALSERAANQEQLAERAANQEQLAERAAKAEAEAAALKEQLASLQRAHAHAAAPSTAAAPPTPAPSAASPKPAPSPEAMAELLDTPAVDVAVLALREAMQAGEGGIGTGAHLEVLKKAIKERRKRPVVLDDACPESSPDLFTTCPCPDPGRSIARARRGR